MTQYEVEKKFYEYFFIEGENSAQIEDIIPFRSGSKLKTMN